MQVKIGPYPDIDSVFDGQEMSIHIDEWDTWNMSETLGEIALPMLKQLKEHKQGSPHVELEDVPEELRLHGSSRNETMQLDLFADKEYDSDCWQAMHDRWDWVMDEMIFAFESIVGSNSDWEEKYWSGKSDYYFEEVPGTDFTEMKKGPNHTLECDWNGYRTEGERIANGFRLFGKYYQGLWD